MSRLIFLALMLGCLPLIGVFWNTLAVLIVSGMAWAGLAGAMMVAPTDLKWTLLAQVPLLALTTTMALKWVRKLTIIPEKAAAPAYLKKLTEMKARHALLKEKVVKGEGEEALSLQIYGVAKSLAEALSWKDMAPRLTSGIQKIFGSNDFLLYAIDDHNEWTVLHRRGNWTKEPPVSGAISAEPQFFFPPHVQEIQPVVVVPIVNESDGGGALKGVLFLKTTDERGEKEILEIAREFGAQLGMAISKALLFSQMELHSRVDGLTGVLRRQAFMDRMNEELKKASAFRTPFCVLMVDIDHFKHVNDGHGHAAGDAVLQRAGQILKESFYETDVVGRYGGEEFVVLLPRAQAEGVYRKAENLRRRFEQEAIKSGFEELRVTVSIGLSHFPEHGRTIEELIARADEALYKAKETGRNRVVAA